MGGSKPNYHNKKSLRTPETWNNAFDLLLDFYTNQSFYIRITKFNSRRQQTNNFIVIIKQRYKENLLVRVNIFVNKDKDGVHRPSFKTISKILII